MTDRIRAEFPKQELAKAGNIYTDNDGLRIKIEEMEDSIDSSFYVWVHGEWKWIGDGGETENLFFCELMTLYS